MKSSYNAKKQNTQCCTLISMKVQGCIYIMMDENNTKLYVGVTSDLNSRILKHKNNYYSGSYTARNKIHKLVYFEYHKTMVEAIMREKRIKKWRRKWKMELIISVNPDLTDLFKTSRIKPGMTEVVDQSTVIPAKAGICSNNRIR